MNPPTHPPTHPPPQETYRPVRVGDTFLARGGMRAVEFKVLSVETGEEEEEGKYCIVGDETEVEISEEPLSREDDERLDELVRTWRSGWVGGLCKHLCFSLSLLYPPTHPPTHFLLPQTGLRRHWRVQEATGHDSRAGRAAPPPPPTLPFRYPPTHPPTHPPNP